MFGLIQWTSPGMHMTVLHDVLPLLGNIVHVYYRSIGYAASCVEGHLCMWLLYMMCCLSYGILSTSTTIPWGVWPHVLSFTHAYDCFTGWKTSLRGKIEIMLLFTVFVRGSHLEITVFTCFLFCFVSWYFFNVNLCQPDGHYDWIFFF